MLKPINRNIMVLLPKWQKDRARETKSGILIPHLEGRFGHNATHGTVVAVGDNCQFTQIGDEVFFPSLTVKQALQNSGLDPTEREKFGSGVPIHYYIDGDNHYLLFPENKISQECIDYDGSSLFNTIFSGVIVIKRGEQVIPVNDWFLMEQAHEDTDVVEGVKGKQVGALFLPELREKDEKLKKYRLTGVPADSDLSVGDTVWTAPHCDIELEGEFNYRKFPEKTFYCEAQFVLASLPAS